MLPISFDLDQWIRDGFKNLNLASSCFNLQSLKRLFLVLFLCILEGKKNSDTSFFFFQVLLMKKHKRRAQFYVAWFDFDNLQACNKKSPWPLITGAVFVLGEQPWLRVQAGGPSSPHSPGQTGKQLRWTSSSGKESRHLGSRQHLQPDSEGLPLDSGLAGVITLTCSQGMNLLPNRQGFSPGPVT